MSDSEKMQEEPVILPLEVLSDAAVEGIIKDFVLREGTDYGSIEYSLAQKIDKVKKQLATGEAQILYDATSETCTIALRSQMSP